eukprot:scaffold231142_cov39-Tisochrysis_lutea.AAC.2
MSRTPPKAGIHFVKRSAERSVLHIHTHTHTQRTYARWPVPQGIVFITFSGLRGAVCLILAQSVLTMESASDPKHNDASFGPDGVSVLGAEDLVELDYIQGRRKTERKVSGAGLHTGAT